MKEVIKEFTVIFLITIGLTIATIISFHFNFKFISGFIFCPTLLFYCSVYIGIKELYRTYVDERNRVRRDEEWRKEQLVRDVMES